jgi:hypothetical protein
MQPINKLNCFTSQKPQKPQTQNPPIRVFDINKDKKENSEKKKKINPIRQDTFEFHKKN